MSFNYAVLNPQVLETIKLIYAKPATEWTAHEILKVQLGLEAMRIVASHAKVKQ